MRTTWRKLALVASGRLSAHSTMSDTRLAWDAARTDSATRVAMLSNR
jgi:hypothetical protein